MNNTIELIKYIFFIPLITIIAMLVAYAIYLVIGKNKFFDFWRSWCLFYPKY